MRFSQQSVDGQSEELLNHLVRIAKCAGQKILTYDPLTVEKHKKQDNTIVTRADIEAEKIICQHLKDIMPNTLIIAEESIAELEIPQEDAMHHHDFFLIDPLDGTKGYAMGRKEYTVNIALMRNAKPYMGVIYAPALGVTYSAIFDEMNGVSLLRRVYDGVEKIDNLPSLDSHKTTCVAIASALHSDSQTWNFLQDRQIEQKFSMGSSLKFCYIAEGRADIYPRFGPVMEWDTAAADVILSAVGGKITSLAMNTPLEYGKMHQNFKHNGFIAMAPHVMNYF